MHQECAPRVIQPCIDPRELMPEQEFKHYFRFSKRTVTLIAEAFDQELRAADKRDIPL